MAGPIPSPPHPPPVLSDAVPLTLSRALVLDLAPALGRLPSPNAACAARRALAALEPRAVSHGDAVTALRHTLAAAHEAQEEWGAAAAALAGVDADALPPPARLRHAVRVAMLYLEDGDAGAADAAVRRAASLVTAGAAEGDPGAELRYRTCAARVLDARRDFAKAAAAYIAIAGAGAGAVGTGGERVRGERRQGAGTGRARVPQPRPRRPPPSPISQLVSDADIETALASASTCAVLAPPGPARARALAALARDPRAAGLPLAAVLTRVAADRLLTKADVDAVDAALAPHQRAVGAGGETLLARAARAHNVAAAARVYASLSLADLGALLGVPADAAEGVAAGLAAGGGVVCRIDAVAGIVTFGDPPTAAAAFDAAVADVCAALDAAAA